MLVRKLAEIVLITVQIARASARRTVATYSFASLTTPLFVFPKDLPETNGKAKAAPGLPGKR